MDSSTKLSTSSASVVSKNKLSWRVAVNWLPVRDFVAIAFALRS